MGFMAARTTITSPVLMPPSMPPAVVAAAHVPELGVVLERVVHLAAGQPRRSEAQAELHALDRRHREDRGGECGLEAAIAVNIRAHAGRIAEGEHFDDAAERVAGRLRRVHGGAHARARRRVGAAQRVGLDPRDVLEAQRRRRGALSAHRDDVAHHAAADGREQELRDGSAGDSRRGLARAGAFDDVADVVQVVEQRPGEIGVPGARHAHRLRRGSGISRGLHREHVAPVAGVTVRDGQARWAPRWCARSARRRRSPRGRSRWSAGRHGRSRPGAGARSSSMRAAETSRPAGQPSSTAVNWRPCDSPAVKKRKRVMVLPYRALRAREQRCPPASRTPQTRQGGQRPPCRRSRLGPLCYFTTTCPARKMSVWSPCTMVTVCASTLMAMISISPHEVEITSPTSLSE